MILPTRSAQITAIAQGPLPLRPWRLVVSEFGTAGGVADWVIDDIKIGNRSQFRQSGSIPADLLVRDDELARYVAFDLVMPSRSVTMDVTYIGLNEGGAYFFAGLVGKPLRRRDVITSRS